MIVRVATVIKVYPKDGKVKVTFEDAGNSSVPLPMVTYNGEYSMPKVGDIVLTLHFENGSNKGVCLGTFYGGDNEPNLPENQRVGYLKDFEIDENNEIHTYLRSKDGIITIEAKDIILKCEEGSVAVSDLVGRGGTL